MLWLQRGLLPNYDRAAKLHILCVWVLWHCIGIIIFVCLHVLRCWPVFRVVGYSVLQLLYRHVCERCWKWRMHKLRGRLLSTKHDGRIELHQLRSWDVELIGGGVVAVNLHQLRDRIVRSFVWPVLVYLMRRRYFCYRIGGDWMHRLR